VTVNGFTWTSNARAVSRPSVGPYAHGFLTLSLLSRFINDSVSFGASKMGVNYGFHRARFTDPVPVGARIRARLAVKGIEDIDGGVQLTWDVKVEREGAGKPCLVAECLTRRYD
jgi:acyl dehydratase